MEVERVDRQGWGVAFSCSFNWVATSEPVCLVQPSAPPLPDGRRTRVEDDGWLGE